MTDFITQFKDALSAAGQDPVKDSDIIADDKWRSYQIVGQKGGKKAGRYQLAIDGDFAYGRFLDFRDGTCHSWISGAEKKMSKEEKAARRLEIEAIKARRDEETASRQEEKAAEASHTFKSAKPANLDHPYLVKKGVAPFHIRQIDTDLIVPMYSIDNKLCAIQRISEDGEKLYMYEARKKGLFYPITKPDDDRSKIIICEGFATGASIKMAMPNHPVIVAFDAGNLLPVAADFRVKFPDATIVMAADNDRFTTDSTGAHVNIGKKKAQEAAAKIAGHTIWPEFPEDDETSTDFNDMHLSSGLDTVTRVLSEAKAVKAEEQKPKKKKDKEQTAEEIIDEAGFRGMPFRVLGQSKGKYYYYTFGNNSIQELTSNSHGITNLVELAPLQYWEEEFGGGMNASHSKIALLAWNALKEAHDRKPAFVSEDRIRGVGAWMDAGRLIIHCGDVLYVDGKETQLKDVVSGNVYIQSSSFIRLEDEGATDEEASKLIEICESLNWENKLSGTLLAGWMAMAPVCSALAWRPHIWLTGESGAGKTTVVDNIVKPVLGKIALKSDGGTTEAFLRGHIGYDGRPIIYDEAEADKKKMVSIMEGVIELARKASDGKPVGKYGQQQFRAQFTAMFSGIDPPVDKTADESRIVFMNLKKNYKPGAQSDYYKLLDNIARTITPEFSRRLLRRTVDSFKTTVSNIAVFKRAAMSAIGSARAADQIAVLMSFVYSLRYNNKAVTDAEAVAIISGYSWEQHTNINEAPDPMRLLSYICTCIMRYTPVSGNSKEVSVGDIIKTCITESDEYGMDVKWASKQLRHYGIIANQNGVVFANKNQNLARLLKDTSWGIRWSRTLSDVLGSVRKKQIYFGVGDKQDAIMLPKEYFIEGDNNG